jgi:hypothetical protein
MSSKKRSLEGIAEGGALSGKYPKMSVAVQTLPKAAIARPVPGTDLNRDDSITFVMQVPLDSMIR